MSAHEDAGLKVGVHTGNAESDLALISKALRDVAKAQREQEGANETQKKSTNKLTQGLHSLKSAYAAVAGAAAVAGTIKFTQFVLETGAAVQETADKFRIALGPAIKEADEFLGEYANKMGLTVTEAREMMATTAVVAQGMGASAKASAEMSEQIVRLAGDVAAFNNLPTEQVLHALTSALTGEREALKRLGLYYDEAALKEQVLLDTKKNHISEVTREEKALAAVALMYDRAGVQVGNLEETLDTTQGTTRQLGAMFREAKEIVATEFLPVIEEFIPDVDEARESMEDFRQTAEKAAEAAAIFGGILKTLNAIDKAIYELDPKGAFSDLKETWSDVFELVRGTGDEMEAITLPPTLDEFMEKWRKEQQGVKKDVEDTKTAYEQLTEAIKAAKEQAEQAFIQSTADRWSGAGGGGLSGISPWLGLDLAPVRTELAGVAGSLEYVADETTDWHEGLQAVGSALEEVNRTIGLTAGVVWDAADAWAAVREAAESEGGVGFSPAQLNATAFQGAVVPLIGSMVSGIRGLFEEDAASRARHQQMELDRLDREREATERFQESVEQFEDAVGGTPSSLTAWFEDLNAQLDALTRTAQPRTTDPLEIEAERLKLEQLLADKMAEVTALYHESLDVRELAALGLTEESEALRREIDNRKELAAAEAAGWDVETRARLAEIQALEELARAREEEAKAAKEAARLAKEAAAIDLSLEDRRSLIGLQGDELEMRQKEIEQRNELNKAIEDGWSEDQLAALREILGLEWDQFIDGLNEVVETIYDPTALEEDIRLRTLQVRGMNEGYEILQLQLKHQRELNEAIEDGASDDLVEALKALQEAELAGLFEEIAEAAELAAEAQERYQLSLIEDIRVRELYAAGLDEEARLLQLQIRQQQALNEAIEAGVTGGVIERLKELQTREYQNLWDLLYPPDEPRSAAAPNVTTPTGSTVHHSTAAGLSETAGMQMNAILLSSLAVLQDIAGSNRAIVRNTGGGLDAGLGGAVVKQEIAAGRVFV